jgi:hypothetical protein
MLFLMILITIYRIYLVMREDFETVRRGGECGEKQKQLANYIGYKITFKQLIDCSLTPLSECVFRFLSTEGRGTRNV